MRSEVLPKDTLLSPAKLASSIEVLAPFLTVDSALSPTYLAGLGASMPSIRAYDIRFIASPTLGTGMVDIAAVVHPDWDELKIIAQHFRVDTLAEYSVPK